MISRIDQAVLLLQDRLQRLASRGGAPAAQIAQGHGAEQGPIEQLRALRKRGDLGRDDLRRAFVRSLLVETLGTDISITLDFQAVADQVSTMLTQSETGRALMDRALHELGLD